MTRTILLLFGASLAVLSSCTQTDPSQSLEQVQSIDSKHARLIYSNWISTAYLKCLETDLPCACEQSEAYFLASIDTAQKQVLFYIGASNSERSPYKFKVVAPTILEVYKSFKDTIAVIGQLKIQADTLFFVETSGKQTQFIRYSTGDSDRYFEEHVKLLNTALKNRGYKDLNTLLHSDSLRCWCNWEIARGTNIVHGPKKEWILEKKENEVYIYEWVNPPQRKSVHLEITKHLLQKLKW